MTGRLLAKAARCESSALSSRARRASAGLADSESTRSVAEPRSLGPQCSAPRKSPCGSAAGKPGVSPTALWGDWRPVSRAAPGRAELGGTCSQLVHFSAGTVLKVTYLSICVSYCYTSPFTDSGPWWCDVSGGSGRACHLRLVTEFTILPTAGWGIYTPGPRCGALVLCAFIGDGRERTCGRLYPTSSPPEHCTILTLLTGQASGRELEGLVKTGRPDRAPRVHGSSLSVGGLSFSGKDQAGPRGGLRRKRASRRGQTLPPGPSLPCGGHAATVRDDFCPVVPTGPGSPHPV